MTPKSKRKPLRKKSRSEYRKWVDKADRAVQDFYRATYPEAKCESCGAPFELMHHYYEKSRSAGLRFEPTNLIFLCKRCHTLHHLFHDASVMSRVLLRRGMEWLGKLTKMYMERKNSQINVFLCKKIVEQYALPDV